MELEEEMNVLCTVKRIVGTTVFVNIDNYNKEATIITSEIAPGRIRNLRDYVVPNKKIVCKILKIDKGIHLSLRRVTDKEKRVVLDKYNKEKSSISIIKSVSKDSDKIIEKIKEKSYLYDFLQDCKTNPEKLEKFFSKEESLKICKILQERKERQVEVKKTFLLSTKKSAGLSLIKKLLSAYDVTYIAAGRYSIKIQAENYKVANQQLDKILEEIETKADQEDLDFEVKEK